MRKDGIGSLKKLGFDDKALFHVVDTCPKTLSYIHIVNGNVAESDTNIDSGPEAYKEQDNDSSSLGELSSSSEEAEFDL